LTIRQLLTEKEELETELKSPSSQRTTPAHQQELDELEREIVRLKAKTSVLNIENRRLSSRIPNSRPKSPSK
jgi:hypothetical protein